MPGAQARQILLLASTALIAISASALGPRPSALSSRPPASQASRRQAGPSRTAGTRRPGHKGGEAAPQKAHGTGQPAMPRLAPLAFPAYCALAPSHSRIHVAAPGQHAGAGPHTVITLLPEVPAPLGRVAHAQVPLRELCRRKTRHARASMRLDASAPPRRAGPKARPILEGRRADQGAHRPHRPRDGGEWTADSEGACGLFFSSPQHARYSRISALLVLELSPTLALSSPPPTPRHSFTRHSLIPSTVSPSISTSLLHTTPPPPRAALNRVHPADHH
ncbi:unnamed protein product [Cutaneotrichosporon oleaginosum]